MAAYGQMWGVCLYLFRSIATKALALTPNLEVVPTLPVARSTEVWCERGIVQTQRSYTNGPSSQRHPYHWPLRINKLKSKLQTRHLRNQSSDHRELKERGWQPSYLCWSSGCRWRSHEGIGSRQLEGGLVERTQTEFDFLEQATQFLWDYFFFIWKMGIIIP